MYAPLFPVVSSATPALLVTVVAPLTATVAPASIVVSLLLPMVMLSASELVPMVMVSQAAELQMDVLVAVVLPIASAPADALSMAGVKTDVSA